MPALEPAHELELIAIYKAGKKKRNSDPDALRAARDAATELLAHHAKPFLSLVQWYADHSDVDFGELESEGTIGFCEAIKRFNPRKGVRFWTYARPWVLKYLKQVVAKSFNRRDEPVDRRDPSPAGSVTKMSVIMRCKGWTNKDVAQKVGATEHNVEQWCSGGSRPFKQSHREGLRRIFGDQFAQLFDYPDRPFLDSLRSQQDAHDDARYEQQFTGDDGASPYLSAEDATEMGTDVYYYDE